MKKNAFVKAAVLGLAAAMSLGMVSCGSSSSKADDKDEDSPAETVESKAAELTGTEKTWGIYTVKVPDGWTLRTGDALNDQDENYCSVKKSDFSYFNLKNESEEVQKKQYEYNKNTYTLNQKDIPTTKLGEIEWTGFEYGNDFSKGFELFAKSGDKFLRVSCAGFAFDSAEAKFVLESLKIK